MADAAEAAGVVLPPIPAPEAARLKAVLGPLVTIANPLDYQTFIWGDGVRMGEVFTAAVHAGDAGLFVLDLPRADRCSTASYDCVFEALQAARLATGKPVFAVASLQDSVDETVAERFAKIGVVPLQGIAESFAAIRAASAAPARAGWRPLVPSDGGGAVLDEVAGKALLAAAGIAVPRGVTAERLDALDAGALVPPFALKGLGFAHKSEAGAVRLGLPDLDGVAEMPGASGYLLEEMVQGGVAEVLIGARRDPVCGVALTLGMGGVETELLADTVTLVAPVTRDEIGAALRQLRLWLRLDGYRGRARADVAAAVDVAFLVQGMLMDDAGLSEIEINPLILREAGAGAVAVDALIRKE